MIIFDLLFTKLLDFSFWSILYFFLVKIQFLSFYFDQKLSESMIHI